MKNLTILLLLIIMVLVFTPEKNESNSTKVTGNVTDSSTYEKKKIAQIKRPSYPDKNSIRRDSHYLSQEYVDFARQMGRLKKEILARPQNLNQGLDFLIECTHNNELTIAIRSLCLSNIYYFEKKFNIKVSEIPSNERLTQLARLVSDL
ncbi:MAG: hypothetical protein ACO20H_03580 [Bacteriovoracaceae bacterium]